MRFEHKRQIDKIKTSDLHSKPFVYANLDFQLKRNTEVYIKLTAR